MPHLFFSTMVVRPWSEIAEFLGSVRTPDGGSDHMHELLRSIEASGVTDQICGGTSMHDVIVVPAPADRPLRQGVIVRAPGSLKQGPRGTVTIAHLTESGRNERIVRPTEDTVPLFWRFIAEKYGNRRAPGLL